MSDIPHRSFCTNYPSRALTLHTNVAIKKVTEKSNEKLKTYKALWDTGATQSVITKNIVDDLQLVPIDSIPVHHAGGKSLSDVYLIDIVLPNHVIFSALRVTTMQVTNNFPINVLIGMDIISSGDFAVTNHNGKTSMSFMFPSYQKIDFVDIADKINMEKFGNREQKRDTKSNGDKK